MQVSPVCSRQEKQRMKVLTLVGKHILHAHHKCAWFKLQRVDGKSYSYRESSTVFGTFNLSPPLKSFSWENHNETYEPFHTSPFFCRWMWKALALLFQHLLLKRHCTSTLASFPVPPFHRTASICTNSNPVVTFLNYTIHFSMYCRSLLVTCSCQIQAQKKTCRLQLLNCMWRNRRDLKRTAEDLSIWALLQCCEGKKKSQMYLKNQEWFCVVLMCKILLHKTLTTMFHI